MLESSRSRHLNSLLCRVTPVARFQKIAVPSIRGARMGNLCACCKFSQGGHDAMSSKKDAWFDQDSVPLVTAKHDLNEAGLNEADGLLKRKILIRSPRPSSASGKDTDRTYSQPPHRLQHQHEHHEKHHHKHKVKATSMDSSSYFQQFKHCDERLRPECHSGHRRMRKADDNDWRIARFTSLEVQDSTRELRLLSSPKRTPRISQNAASFADDEVESVDSSHGLTRSHRSSSNGSLSPKVSSKSTSPQKKSRYGRKQYRADANLTKMVPHTGQLYNYYMRNSPGAEHYERKLGVK